MLHLHNILAAVDFSECSAVGLQLALRLAGKTGARVHVVFVQVLHADPFAPAVYPADHQQRVTNAIREQAAQAFRALVMNDRSVDVSYDVIQDLAVTPAIERFARNYAIDLTVVGTHGRRGLRHMMLGSVAEELVRTLPCPVLTVRSDAEVRLFGEGEKAEVLVPIDFSSHSIEAVHTGREVAALFSLPMRLLHVVEETLHPAFYNAGAFSIYDLQPDVEERAWAHLQSILSETPGPVVPVELEVVDGRAAAEIVRVARERGSSLVVMATHGLTGLAHLFMGSVAEKVVRSSPCPTLVVKSFGQSLFAQYHEDHFNAEPA